MADSEVSVRIRIKGARTAAVEAEVVAESIDNIGDKAAKARRELRELDRQQLASKGLALMAAQGRTTAGQLGSVAGSLRGVWLAAAVASPGLLALSGGLISIAGSAGAAMLGGAAVGGGGIAALVVGLGGLGLVTKTAAGEFKKTGTALDAYNLAVQQYGHGSVQAVTAQAHLNALVAEQGGPKMLAAVNNWRALGKAWHDATGSARSSVGGIFSDGISAAHGLLPTFARQTNLNASAMRSSLRWAMGALSGSEARSGIGAFGGAFRQALPGLTAGSTDGLIALLRVLRASLPYVVQFAIAFGKFGHHLEVITSNGQRVNGVVGGLVGHLKSWLNLGHALGAVMYDLLAGGAKEGKGLVDSLAGVVWHFDRFLDHARKTGQLQAFFHETAKDTRLIGHALVVLGTSLGSLLHGGMPGFTAALGGASAYLNLMAPRLQLVSDVLRWLGPLAKPVTEFFLIWKTAGLVIGGIDATVGALSRLRTGLFGVAAAEATTAGAQTAGKFGEQLAFDLPGTVESKGGLFKRMGSRMGSMLGMAGWIGFAAVFIANLPSLLNMLPLGDAWHHEAKRGFKDLIPGMEENAGPSTKTEHAMIHKAGKSGLRLGASHSQLLDFYRHHRRQLRADWSALSPSERHALQAGGLSVKGKLAHVARNTHGDVHVRVPVYLNGHEIATAVAQDTRDQINRR